MFLSKDVDCCLPCYLSFPVGMRLSSDRIPRNASAHLRLTARPQWIYGLAGADVENVLWLGCTRERVK